jgi:hypothetical protein
MNERFLELARRVVGKHRNDVSSISLFDQQIEQFAELTIRACAELAAGKPANFSDRDAYTLGRKQSSEDILKHFGVDTQKI